MRPVKWSYSAKQISSNEVILFFKADIDEGWHIYSVYQKSGGPKKTSFSIKNKRKEYELIGKIVEPKPQAIFDDVFDMNVNFFSKQVVFQQRIRKKLKTNIFINGELEYMACDDHQCLPPEIVNFSVPIK